jgi:hypothetical protein
MPCPSHPPWLHHSNYVWRGVQVMKLLIMQTIPSIHCIGGFVGPRASLNIEKERKIPCPYWELNSDSSVKSLADWHIPELPKNVMMLLFFEWFTLCFNANNNYNKITLLSGQFLRIILISTDSDSLKIFRNKFKFRYCHIYYCMHEK